MRTKLKVGIIGCGGIALQNHIPVWKKLKVDIIAIDSNISALQKIKKKCDITKTYSSLQEALENEKLDIIDNCTPVQLHATLSLVALKNGIHTLVEKPMATNYKDAQEMVKLAESKGLTLGVIHNTLFNPFYLEIKRLLAHLNDKGAEITKVDIEYIKRQDDPWIIDKKHWSHQLELGMITEILAHPLYIIDDILNGKSYDLKVLMAVAGRFFVSTKYPYVKYDELQAVLQNKLKKIANITVTLNSVREDVILRIYTTRGLIESSLWRGIIKLKGRMIYDIKSFAIDSIQESIQILKHTLKNVILKIRGKLIPGHHFLIPNFYDAVIHKRKPKVSGDDGLRIVKLMEEITNMVKK